jgi:hypothetical protein
MKRTTQQFIWIGLLCAISAGCAPEKVLSVQDYQASLVCDGNQQVHVVFAPFKAVLEAQGVSVAMVQQPVADGYRYTGGGQSLRQAGQEVTWTDGKGAVHHCRAAPATPAR